MATEESDIALSPEVLDQMRQVIIETYAGTGVEQRFRNVVRVEQYASLDAAVADWLEEQLVNRNEEVLEEVFKFFIASMTQDLFFVPAHPQQPNLELVTHH